MMRFCDMRRFDPVRENLLAHPSPIMKRRFPLFACSALAAAAISPLLSAQGTIQSWVGDAGYQFLGYDVAAVGDINGDGYADVLMGGPGDNGFGQSSGIARLYSGADGSQLWSWNGAAGQDELGRCVSGAGDVNNDGVPDLIICSPKADFNGQGSGRARVYSGANFSLLYTIDGAAAKDFMGFAAAALGDVNFDGYDDFAIGASQFDDDVAFPGPGVGYVNVYSGRTGAMLYQFTGAHNTAFMGHALGTAGDVNGDGAADILVGAYGEDQGAKNSGRVYLFSGADGSTLYTWDGDNIADKLGISVEGAGDVNNDGVRDIIAGGHHSNTSGAKAGLARVFSGADGSILYTWYGDNPDDLFGMSVAGGQDLDSDGYDDLLVGIRHDDSFGDNSGAARAYSGIDGSEIWTAKGFAQDDLFGHAVAMSPDISGDGVPDVIVGGIQYNNGPGPGNGIVHALDPTTGPPPPPLPYPNLPGSFISIATGLSDGFEVHAGTIPGHLAINELSVVTRMYDPNAWCNIGQNGACTGGVSGIGPRNGIYDLEMGAVPGSAAGTTVACGLIYGLNGGGSTAFELDFWVYNFGEEPDNDDGVWVSDNGIDWEKVGAGWSGRPVDQWTHATGIDLGSTSVDISGDFYLLFAQTDNFPVGELDGILIDDITITPVIGGGYQISDFTPGTAGGVNTIMLDGGTPGVASTFAYDFRLGSTPIPGCPGLTVDLKKPRVLGSAIADGTGHAEFSAFVPPAASGVQIYLQAVELSTCQVADVYGFMFP
jgi:FG-GAP repeat protein